MLGVQTCVNALPTPILPVSSMEKKAGSHCKIENPNLYSGKLVPEKNAKYSYHSILKTQTSFKLWPTFGVELMLKILRYMFSYLWQNLSSRK